MQEYYEEQKLNLMWMWLISIGAFFAVGYGLFQQVVLGQPLGSNPAPDAVLWTIACLILGILLTMAMTILKTRISKEGISIRYRPFGSEKIFWSEVESFSIQKPDVKGVGVRSSPLSRFKYYNTHIGDMLILKLKNGRKVGVGTKRAAELRDFLHNLIAEKGNGDLLRDLQENRERIELKNRR